MITTTDPVTGRVSPTTIAPSDPDEVATVAAAAVEAFAVLKRIDREDRACLLDEIADALEDDRAALVATAMRETGLAQARLDGELTRSAFQFRLFAEAVRDGGYLEASIDHAGPTPMGPGPDLRRMLVPIGPVAVFGSSNFPFAFSVAGGDTASALAAGNSVVAKAHGSHPETSRRSFEVLQAAVASRGMPEGTVGIVYGQRAGSELVATDSIRAVGFTGSQATGEILLGIIADRERPIPFYGELSSLNPLIVTHGAAAERGEEIARGLFQSITGSSGQLCTKPGIVFVPRDAYALQSTLVGLVQAAPPAVLLNERIFASYSEISRRLGNRGARLLAQGTADGDGFAVAPTVLGVDASDLTAELVEEAFGPLALVVAYDELSEIADALDAIPDSLSAAIHSSAHEVDVRTVLVDELRERVGRLVFDDFPTGVRVSWAQHHGGPWPATNSQHTSVGVTAIRRFLRPLVWQNAPSEHLPSELREGVSIVPRRVDGRLELAHPSSTLNQED